MRSPAVAIAWAFFAQNRIKVFVAIAIVSLNAFAASMSLADRLVGDMLSTIFTPAYLFIVLPGAFSIALFGSKLAVEKRESAFPASMLRLPIPTYQLALWPMLYGGLIVFAAAYGIRIIFAFEFGETTKASLYAIFAAVACLYWLQAIVWTPMPLPWLRVALCMLATVLEGVLLGVCNHKELSDEFILAVVLAQIPPAYCLALRGIRKARCGETPDWRWFFAALTKPFQNEPPVFQKRSVARELFRFELRSNCRAMPILLLALSFTFAVAIEWSWLYLLRLPSRPVLAHYPWSEPLVVWAMMAAWCSGFALAGFKVRQDAAEPSAFIFCRPVREKDLLMAKLKLAVAFTALLCVLHAVGYGITRRAFYAFIFDFPTIAYVPMFVVFFRLTIDNMFHRFAGRSWVSWLATAAVVVTVCGYCWPTGAFNEKTRTFFRCLVEDAQPLLTFVLWTLVLIKFGLAALFSRTAERRRLLTHREVLWIEVPWVLLVCLLGIIIFSIPPVSKYWHLWLPIVMLAIPLARVTLSPLALAWNRHR